MPATSFKGDVLARRSFHWPRRLAFEVEDDEVVIQRDEHLTQVVVAVDADLVDALKPCETLDSVRDARRLDGEAG